MSQDPRNQEFIDAASRGDIDAARKMIDDGYDPKAIIEHRYPNCDRVFPTPVCRKAFDAAIKGDHVEMARLLRDYVIEVERKKERQSEFSESAFEYDFFHSAFHCNAIRIVREVVSDGPHINHDLYYKSDTLYHNVGVDPLWKYKFRCALYISVIDKNVAMVKAILSRNSTSLQDDCFVGEGKLLFALNECLDSEEDKVSFLCRMGRQELERALKFEKPHALADHRTCLLKAYLHFRESDNNEYLSASVAESVFRTPRAKKILAVKQLLGEAAGAAPWHMIHFGFLGLIHTRTMSRPALALGAGR